MTVEATRPRRSVVQATPSKYRAVRTTVDGIVFHSAAEARRYSELKLLEKVGEVSDLKCQPRFPLTVWTGWTAARPREGCAVIGCYVADFSYWSLPTNGTKKYPKAVFVVEDVKGFRTPLYRWKKKHVEAQYGIVVREIR